MYRDIQQFLTMCEPCARSSQRLPPPVRLQHPDVTKPLETLVIDHLTMPTTVHPLTQQSVSYILTMVDGATCYTVLCPVADTTAKSTALAILYNWIPQYGVPIWLNTDLGPAYTSKIFQELCLLLCITHIFAESQNHKFVARAEVTHRIILTALRKVCAQSTDWVSKLPGIVLSINSSVSSTVGLSAAALLFHRDIRTPFLAQLPIRTQTGDITLSVV